MANFPKWQQVTTGHRASAGTKSPKPKVKTVNEVKSPFGEVSPFGAVTSAQQQAGAAAAPFSGMESGQGVSLAAAMGKQLDAVVSRMGPYANASNVYQSSGSWQGGPLGKVPSHYGFAGMKAPAKEWTLRLLGAFPGLRFSSGLRSPAQNAAVNGHPNSGHMRGWKADFSGSRDQLAAAAAWAKRHGARVLLHDAGSGYHLDVSWEGVRL